MAEQLAKGLAIQGNPHGFKLSSHRRAVGLTLQGAIRVSPQHLTEQFGTPCSATRDGKVSRTYVFEDGRGNTVAIYDWKSTALYDDRPGAKLPTPQAFWASEEPAELAVASSGGVSLIEFARWVGAKSIGVERILKWVEL